LSNELKKLRLNAGGEKESYLVAITHHANEPSALNRFEDEPVYWTNWISVSKRLEQVDVEELPAEQQVPLRMLKDLFEVEQMEPFTGFDHQDKNQYRYFIRYLRPQMNEIGLENRGEIITSTGGSRGSKSKPDPPDWYRIIPKYISIPFVHEGRPSLNEKDRPKIDRASFFLAIVDTEEHRVYAGVVFGVEKVSNHRKLLQEHGTEILEECHSDGFEMWIGRRSINHRDISPEKTRELAEMKKWMTEEKEGKRLLEDPEEDNKYRKVWLVRECTEDDPEELLSSVVDTIDEQKKRFLERDEFVERFSLVAPGTVE